MHCKRIVLALQNKWRKFSTSLHTGNSKRYRGRKDETETKALVMVKNCEDRPCLE